jgi:hypothetical protein
VDEAEEGALEVDVLGDEQRHEADHGGAAVPPLVLGVEGAVLAAVRGLLVVHGDERGADDDGRHEQEPDEAAPLRHLLPHALPRHNLRHERPRDAQHRQPAVDRLRRRPVELHQTLRARVPVLGTSLLLGPEKLLHWRPLKNPQRVILLLRLPLRPRLAPKHHHQSATPPNPAHQVREYMIAMEIVVLTRGVSSVCLADTTKLRRSTGALSRNPPRKAVLTFVALETPNPATVPRQLALLSIVEAAILYSTLGKEKLKLGSMHYLDTAMEIFGCRREMVMLVRGEGNASI